METGFNIENIALMGKKKHNSFLTVEWASCVLVINSSSLSRTDARWLLWGYVRICASGGRLENPTAGLGRNLGDGMLGVTLGLAFFFFTTLLSHILRII